MFRFYSSGWDIDGIPTITDGTFNGCIPLRFLLGFFENFKKVIENTLQELILIRSNTDDNAVITSKAVEKPQITINTIIWKFLHVSLSDAQKLKFL